MKDKNNEKLILVKNLRDDFYQKYPKYLQISDDNCWIRYIVEQAYGNENVFAMLVVKLTFYTISNLSIPDHSVLYESILPIINELDIYTEDNLNQKRQILYTYYNLIALLGNSKGKKIIKYCQEADIFKVKRSHTR